MSFDHSLCDPTGSTERPMILTPRFSNSGLIFAMYPSSVVHTGVKSLGCENRTHQLFPIHSWNRMVPSVVSAVKSGAVSPRRMAMMAPPSVFVVYRSAYEKRVAVATTAGGAALRFRLHRGARGARSARGSAGRP